MVANESEALKQTADLSLAQPHEQKSLNHL